MSKQRKYQRSAAIVERGFQRHMRPLVRAVEYLASDLLDKGEFVDFAVVRITSAANCFVVAYTFAGEPVCMVKISGPVAEYCFKPRCDCFGFEHAQPLFEVSLGLQFVDPSRAS